MSEKRMKMEDFFPKSGFIQKMNETLLQIKEGKAVLNEENPTEEIKDFKGDLPNEEPKIEEPKDDSVKIDKTIKLDTIEEFLKERIGKEVVFSYGRKIENMLVVASKGKVKSVTLDADFLTVRFDPNFTFFIAVRKVKTIQFGTIKGNVAYFIKGHEKQDNLVIRG